MTKLPLLSRLTRSNHEGEVDPRSVATTSAIAAAWCIVMGLVIIVVPVLLGWAFSSGPAAAFAEALRSTGHIWIAAHHVPVILAGVNVSVLPLGLLVLPITLLYLAGRWAARAATPASTADALVLALSTAGAYALFNVIVNAWVSTSSVSSAWWKVLITTGLLGFVTVGMAIAREQKLSLKDRVDARVQLITKAASIGVVAILALSSLLAAVALGFHLDEVTGSFTLLGTGVVGGLLLTIISLLYLPNIAVWSASFALGPGFLMGTGTQVAASTTQTGALPWRRPCGRRAMGRTSKVSSHRRAGRTGGRRWQAPLLEGVPTTSSASTAEIPALPRRFVIVSECDLPSPSSRRPQPWRDDWRRQPYVPPGRR